MKLVAKSGAVLAAAAFTLAVTGTTFTTAPAFAADNVKCQGVNACKGQGACKAPGHSCKGQNACKGQGWINTTAAQCKAWGGTVNG
jgi:uncharacterized membrane protein